MIFTTREDIEAPIAFVFQRVTDFGNYEKQALRRGADVRRTDDAPVPQEGSGWDIVFKYRGKDRKLHAVLTQLDEPNMLVLNTVSGGIESVAKVELVPLSPARTRVAVTLDITAKTLAARLLLQSVKLAKSNLTKRFKARVAEFAEDTEDRANRAGV